MDNLLGFREKTSEFLQFFSERQRAKVQEIGKMVELVFVLNKVFAGMRIKLGNCVLKVFTKDY